MRRTYKMAQKYNLNEELYCMKQRLAESLVSKGAAITNDRQRMLDRDLTAVRIIGGYRGSKVSNVTSGLLEEPLEQHPVKYSPTRGLPAKREGVETYAIGIPRTGCYLLPEAVDEQGRIHVSSEHGMNIGILIARAKSPRIAESQHYVPELMLSNISKVDGEPLIYGPGSNSLIICGENTFVDVIPGRLYMASLGNITSLAEILADKNKPARADGDLKLLFAGAGKTDRLLNPGKAPKLLTRGLSLGETFEGNLQLGTRDFRASDDPLDRYTLKFVFD